MTNLLVICGGVSPEHEISLRSTKNILNALDRSSYKIIVVGISRSGKWILLDEEAFGTFVPNEGIEVHIHPGSEEFLFSEGVSLGPIDIVFPMLHGPNGEDGSIQGLLELLQVPYVGTGVLGSSASMDKDVTKQLLSRSGVGVAKWITIRTGDTLSFLEASNKLGEILFIKPANMGSSVGVSRVSNANEWQNALDEAFKYDSKVLIEEAVVGRELECAVIGNESPEASGVGEVKSGEVYTYEKKYADSSSAKIVIPAQVSDSELNKLKEVAINSYKVLHCKGLSRVDMFFTDDGEVLVNEINTMPGFTSISMYPKLWENEGLSYGQLLDKLITLGLRGD